MPSLIIVIVLMNGTCHDRDWTLILSPLGHIFLLTFCGLLVVLWLYAFNRRSASYKVSTHTDPQPLV